MGMIAKDRKIATVQEYKNCNYEPKAAFVSALRDCESELKHILGFKMMDLAVHYALFTDFDKRGWEIVQEYVEVAQDLRAIRDKWAARLHTEMEERRRAKRAEERQICPDCGSGNVVRFEEVAREYYDCLDCTIWFDPSAPEVKEDQQRIRDGKEPLHAL